MERFLPVNGRFMHPRNRESTIDCCGSNPLLEGNNWWFMERRSVEFLIQFSRQGTEVPRR